ncbi:flagellar biosynthetic protein FliR [Pseudoduganella sp. FT26W]|uniref:Flagellar biosynthetic protein FliR n=1 Tax=Duganella aquatilis TaxID=2666082 RepID=A0A844D2W6_9BURK|nr:flagellar biosynthetic protein FliR [Duganella aquatilis]MRW82486.1 flagellar biosynthetic protein FliR [Duganella aquatilis]
MEAIFAQLLPMLTALWWPFCRILAMFLGAPVLGEAVTPTTVRILIALVLAIIMMPLTSGVDWGAAAINPFSMHGVVATIEQGLIGFVLGLAFHFAMSVIGVLGFMVSSQMGMSMAVMNDPMNGQSSDVTSALLSTLAIIVFFSIDGHLVIANVIGQSFRAWPLGHGFGPLLMQTVAYNVAWIFSAAMLLALPVVFSTMVVQIGFGFLNRVAPALNLFALGFSVITIFGLLMLAQMVRFIPEHYVRMTNMVLEMIRQQMQVAIHG